MEKSWKKKAYVFLVSQNISLFGSLVTSFAITWHISLATNSATWMAIATICTILPQIAVSLVGGFLADNYSRKMLIIAADGGIALMTVVLFVMNLKGTVAIGLLLLFTALRSVGQGIQAPAVSATYPTIVPEEALATVNGHNQTMVSVSSFFAPMIGGVILAASNLAIALLVDVVTALIEVGCLTFLTLPKVNQRVKNNMLPELLTGWKVALKIKPLKKLLAVYTASFLFITPMMVLGLIMVQQRFGLDVKLLTSQEVIWGLGSIVGGLIVGKITKKYELKKIVVISLTVFGVLMSLMSVVPLFWMYLLLSFATGLLMSLIIAAQTTVIQTLVPLENMGQVFAAFQMSSNLMILLGSIIFGPLSDLVGIQIIFIASGVLLIISSCLYNK
ncbi:macrolide-efflux protein [Secundilactobacillus kimchicus JCM 15530]|uniref:Macrolide-efflux protein n=1 Tax=Secundilactobacillus kimchicus JCM 15530 TaxID=1302272 RepID=A0A0R1HM35_9LACO|nr:MFS transporter [Secundilactobacillus kimchicus]KRK47829.1 macrolide-efflux protein [Secundilactobacillus kimchicus JCM 15530]